MKLHQILNTIRTHFTYKQVFASNKKYVKSKQVFAKNKDIDEWLNAGVKPY